MPKDRKRERERLKRERRNFLRRRFEKSVLSLSFLLGILLSLLFSLSLLTCHDYQEIWMFMIWSSSFCFLPQNHGWGIVLLRWRNSISVAQNSISHNGIAHSTNPLCLVGTLYVNMTFIEVWYSYLQLCKDTCKSLRISSFSGHTGITLPKKQTNLPAILEGRACIGFLVFHSSSSLFPYCRRAVFISILY